MTPLPARSRSRALDPLLAVVVGLGNGGVELVRPGGLAFHLK